MDQFEAAGSSLQVFAIAKLQLLQALHTNGDVELMPGIIGHSDRTIC